MIQLKRAYDSVAPKDGKRYLVERLWPRGVTKEKLKLDGWLKEIAPSTELRQWFHADATRWPEFHRRYLAELEANAVACVQLLEAVRAGRLTLVYAAHDTEHNSAVVLKEFLEHKLERSGSWVQFHSGTGKAQRTRSKQ